MVRREETPGRKGGFSASNILDRDCRSSAVRSSRAVIPLVVVTCFAGSASAGILVSNVHARMFRIDIGIVEHPDDDRAWYTSGIGVAVVD